MSSTRGDKGLARLLVAANVYVSHGGLEGFWRNLASKSSTLAWAKNVINVGSDEQYNRGCITLAGESGHVREQVVRMVKDVVPRLALETHAGEHPRIGIVDNVVLAPVNERQIAEVEKIASGIARDIAREVPRTRCVVYSKDMPLAEIRRHTSYFWPKNRIGAPYSGPLYRDDTDLIDGLIWFGKEKADPSIGLTCVGAVPWVVNYNVPLQTKDVKLAKDIARAIRTRGNSQHSLPACEAVGLVSSHETVEVACNLIDPSVTSPEAVQSAVERLTELALPGYVIGLPWEEIKRAAILRSTPL